MDDISNIECAICKGDCKGIFHFSFKGKTICGKCVEDLKEILRIKHGNELVSLRELKLKEEISSLKHKDEDSKQLEIEPAYTEASLIDDVFYRNILPSLMTTEDLYVDSNNHDQLLDIIELILPLAYKEIFQTSIPTLYQVRTKVILNKEKQTW